MVIRCESWEAVGYRRLGPVYGGRFVLRRGVAIECMALDREWSLLLEGNR